MDKNKSETTNKKREARHQKREATTREAKQTAQHIVIASSWRSRNISRTELEQRAFVRQTHGTKKAKHNTVKQTCELLKYYEDAAKICSGMQSMPSYTPQMLPKT